MKVNLELISKEAFQKLDEIGFSLKAVQYGAGDIFLSYANHDDSTRINFFFGVREFFSISIAQKDSVAPGYTSEYLQDELKSANITFKKDKLIFENKKNARPDLKEGYLEAIDYNIEKIRELFRKQRPA